MKNRSRALSRRYGHARLTPVRELPAYAVIIRCIHMRGAEQKKALAELRRRGLWLDDEQKRQAGLKK